MATANFVPSLWDAGIQVPFDKELVFGQPGIVNRKYEGQLTQLGDTVHVTTIADPTIRKYDVKVDLEDPDDVDLGRLTLTIDQGDYFQFRVNDVEQVQAAGDFEAPAIARAGVGLRDAVDTYIARLFYAGAAVGNRLGRRTVVDGKPESATVGQTDLYTVLVKLRERLDRVSAPSVGRYVVVPPEGISALLQDERFISADKLGQAGPLLNGQVSRAVGFDILVSNNVAKVGGEGVDKDDFVIAAGISDAVSFANQITQTEANRDPNRFADIVRGLNIYGAKVFRADAIATATVTFATPVAA